MQVCSFAQDGNHIVPVEVELSLFPGLPQVQFTGLPDAIIKESIMRIKSAIHHQGFEWPRTRQITINLRPAYLKKSSQGLDLAIACALLWKTGQAKPPKILQSPYYIYGELSLNGNISVPKDWESLPAKQNGILTGYISGDNYLCPLFQVSNLKGLTDPKLVPVKSLDQLLKKPPLPDISFSKEAAHLLSIIGAGEHSVLLAGEAGSGKSTLAEHLIYILPPPSVSAFSISRKIWSKTGEKLSWRPFVNPHHSTPILSMIGGGRPLFLGEITKAHSGILFMDEYLEFHSRVQEALREPVEKGEIRVVRSGCSEVFPAQFLLVAATNLCPCGDLVPGRKTTCSYSLRRCSSHLDRLNGPMLDRFDILAFSTQWKGQLSVHIKEIDAIVKKAFTFRKNRGQNKANACLSLSELESSLEGFLKNTDHFSYLSSKRRRRAVLRVARTLADMEACPTITIQHIEQAKEFSFIPFTQLKNL